MLYYKTKINALDRSIEVEMREFESIKEFSEYIGGNKTALRFINSQFKNILRVTLAGWVRREPNITTEKLQQIALNTIPYSVSNGKSKRERLEEKIKNLQLQLKEL